MRTGLSVADYSAKLIELSFDPAVSKNIMQGLGEALSTEDRSWAKENLLKSFREQLALRLD